MEYYADIIFDKGILCIQRDYISNNLLESVGTDYSEHTFTLENIL